MISIDDAEEQDKLLEERPPLKFSTPKQDELNKQVNVENEISVVLYKKERTKSNDGQWSKRNRNTERKLGKIEEEAERTKA